MTDIAPPELLTDTGLLAEWYLTYRLDEELERARRYQRPLSVLVAFPITELGDSLSLAAKHAAAAAAQRACRSVDLVGWLGAETILIILPETDPDRAVLAASRLRDEFLKGSAFIGGQSWEVSPVRGVELAENSAQLIQRVLGDVTSR